LRGKIVEVKVRKKTRKSQSLLLAQVKKKFVPPAFLNQKKKKKWGKTIQLSSEGSPV